LSKIEDWAHEAHLDDIKFHLAEVIEVTQLLQISKTKLEDADHIYSSCPHLNPLQIQKILTMYSPGDYEERVPAALIRRVVEKGATSADPAKLMIDAGHLFPVTFPFGPITVRFAELSLPGISYIHLL
jgi:myosin-5